MKIKESSETTNTIDETPFSNEIIIEKKTISFQTSSVKKMLLKKKSIQDFLQEKGYIVKM